MDQIGPSTRYHDDYEEASASIRTSHETTVAGDDALLKDVQVQEVFRDSSIDGYGRPELVEYPKPRRRGSWVARLLMPFRRRRSSFKATVKANDSTRHRKGPRRSHVSIRVCGVLLGLAVLALSVLGVIHICNFIIGLGPALWDDTSDYWLPNWGQPGEHGQDVSHYPTDATRDVLPVPCHSHNDYWRRIPLYEALHYGCTGVEADVWLFDEELYVGHNTAALTKNRTFRSLYVNPIVEILDKQNAKSDFSTSSRNGVFDEDPSQSLMLLVDFKNNGNDIFPRVTEQLSALREKNYLTYFDGVKLVPGAVTVVGTGNVPFDLVKKSTHREIFFDAPLDRMWEAAPTNVNAESASKDAATSPSPTDSPSTSGQGQVGVSTHDDFDPTNSYYASVNFKRTVGILWRGRIGNDQLEKIRGQIRGAHARGLKVRYWNTPAWPVSVRNHVWSTLVREGADMLNVDDLRSAAKLDWRAHWKRDDKL